MANNRRDISAKVIEEFTDKNFVTDAQKAIIALTEEPFLLIQKNIIENVNERLSLISGVTDGQVIVSISGDTFSAATINISVLENLERRLAPISGVTDGKVIVSVSGDTLSASTFDVHQQHTDTGTTGQDFNIGYFISSGNSTTGTSRQINTLGNEPNIDLELNTKGLGQLRSNTLSTNTAQTISDRFVTTDFQGNFQGVVETSLTFVSSDYIQEQLENTDNWTIEGEFIPVLTGTTFQGTKHWDSNYIYEFVEINYPIRIPRV